MTNPATPPTPPAANPLASIGNLQVASRLAALEAAFASLVELQFTHDHDGLASARQWYEAYQAEHAAPSDPPVGTVPVAATGKPAP